MGIPCSGEDSACVCTVHQVNRDMTPSLDCDHAAFASQDHTVGDDAKLKRLEQLWIRYTDRAGVEHCALSNIRQAQATTRALYGEMYNAVRGGQELDSARP